MSINSTNTAGRLDSLTSQMPCKPCRTSEEFLPAQLSVCDTPPLAELSLPFLGSTIDVSGNGMDMSAVTTTSTCGDYLNEDWVVWTAAGHDLSQIQGTVAQCEEACCNAAGCVAFSRAKAAAVTDVTDCWLKAYTPLEERAQGNAVYFSYTRRRVSWGGQADVTDSGAQSDPANGGAAILLRAPLERTPIEAQCGTGPFTSPPPQHCDSAAIV